MQFSDLPSLLRCYISHIWNQVILGSVKSEVTKVSCLSQISQPQWTVTALAVNLANRIIDELHSKPGHFESHSAITSFLSRVLSAIKVTHLENWIPRVYRFRVHSPSCQSFEAWWWRGRGLTNLIFVRSLGYNGFIMTTDSEHFDGRTWKEFWLCCFYTTLAPPPPPPSPSSVL